MKSFEHLTDPVKVSSKKLAFIKLADKNMTTISELTLTTSTEFDGNLKLFLHF